MNIELYGFGVLTLIIVGQFFFQRYTANERDKAKASLKAAEVLGLAQNKIAKDTDKDTKRTKERIDEELKQRLARIDSNDVNELQYIATSLGSLPAAPSTGELAEHLARAIKQIAVRDAKLDSIKKWYYETR